MKKIVLFFILIVFILSSCGYFNLFYNAKKYYKSNNFNLSEEKCNKIINDPGLKYLHDDAYFLLAQIKEKTNRDTEAIYYLKKIVKQYPQSKHVENSINKIVEIYFGNDQNEKIYEFLKNLNNYTQTNIVNYYYAKTLFRLKKYEEFVRIVKNLPKNKTRNKELWALYYYHKKKYSNFSKIIQSFQDEKKNSFILNLFFKTFNKYIAKNYIKNYPKYKFINHILLPKINFNDIIKYKNEISQLSNTQKINFYTYLLEKAITNEMFQISENLALNINLIKEEISPSRKKSKYRLILKKNFINYKELPSNWQKIFSDGTENNFYLFSKNTESNTELELYKLENSRWTKITMNSPPSNLPDKHLIIWDKNYKRWIFLEPNNSQILILDRKNYSWDTLKIEGPLLSSIPEYKPIKKENQIYLFFGLSNISNIEIEEDLLKTKKLKILGYPPSLKNYLLIPFQQKNSFIILGGKENGIKNYNPYIFKCGKSNKWEKGILKGSIDFDDLSIKVAPYQSNYIFLFSWEKDFLKEIQKIYYLTYNQENSLIEIDNFINTPKINEDFYDYEYLKTIDRNIYFSFKDMKTAYNNLYLLKLNSILNVYQNDKNTEESTFSISNTYNKNYFLNINSIFKKLQEINNNNLKKKRIAEIYLIYFNNQKIAEQYYYEYLQNNPNDKKIFYTLGYINYEYLNNVKKAENYFKSFLLLEDPKTELYKNTKKYLEIIKNKKN